MATDCEKFYAGYRWKTPYGVLFESECNTCFPNKPPGYGDSRPAGTSNYTFTAPDGTNFSSLDSAWNYYCGFIIPVPPIVPPIVPPLCTEGATRQVKCPTTNKMVTQKCTGNDWITIKDECNEITTPAKDYTNLIIVVIIIILFMILVRK